MFEEPPVGSGSSFVIPTEGIVTCFFSGKIVTMSRIVYIASLSSLMFINFLLQLFTGCKLFFMIKERRTLLPQANADVTSLTDSELHCKERLIMYIEVLIIMCIYFLVMTIMPDPIKFWFIYPLFYFCTALLIYFVYYWNPGGLGCRRPTQAIINTTNGARNTAQLGSGHTSSSLPLRSIIGKDRVYCRQTPPIQNVSVGPLLTSGINGKMLLNIPRPIPRTSETHHSPSTSDNVAPPPYNEIVRDLRTAD